MTTPKTAQQINDPQTGQVSTSRHSALSELMIQNAELRSDNETLRQEMRILQSSYEALSQMKEKSVASRLEMDELREENDSMKNDLSLWAKYFDKQWPKDVHETIEHLKAENARLAAALQEYERAEPLKKAENKSLCEQVFRLETQLQGCLADAYSLNDGHEWGITRAIKNRMDDAQSNGLADLLAPTIELLEQCRKQPVVCAGHRIDKELARLRGLVERKG